MDFVSQNLKKLNSHRNLTFYNIPESKPCIYYKNIPKSGSQTNIRIFNIFLEPVTFAENYFRKK